MQYATLKYVVKLWRASLVTIKNFQNTNVLIQLIAIKLEIFFHSGNVGIVDVLLVEIPVRNEIVGLPDAECNLLDDWSTR
jgi:hypothetical protein